MTTAPERIPAQSLKTSIELIDDYLPLQAGENPDLRMELQALTSAVVTRTAGSAGGSCFITASDGADLLFLAQSSESPTGWSCQRFRAHPDGVPTDAKPEQVVAWAEQETVFVVALYATAQSGEFAAGVRMRDAAGQWTTPALPQAAAERLRRMRGAGLHVAPSGARYFHGVATSIAAEGEFFLLKLPEWSLAYREPTGSESDIHFLMLSGFSELTGEDGGVRMHYRLDGSDGFPDGASLGLAALARDAGGGLKRSATADGAFTVPYGVRGIAGFPGRRSGFPIAFAYRDSKQFWLLTGSGDGRGKPGDMLPYPSHHGSLRLTSGLPDQPGDPDVVATQLDGEGKSLIYLVDRNRSLWVLRETMHAPGGMPAFNATLWVLLMTDVGAFTCPERTATAGEFYAAVRETREVFYLRQDLRERMWHASSVRVPRQAGTQVPPPAKHLTYVVEISLQGQGGVPAAEAPLEIATENHTTIYINGVRRHVGPGMPAKLASDYRGRVVVKMPAKDLVAPELNVRCADFQPGQQVLKLTADDHVHERLAGGDGFDVSAAAMVRAGVLPPANGRDKDYENLADALRKVATEMRNKRSPAPAKRRSVEPPFAMRFARDAAGRLSTEALTGEALHAPAHARRSLEASAGLGEFFGDLLNLFRHAISVIQDVVLRVVDGVVRFAVTVYGKVREFVLDTVQACGEALSALLRFVQNVVQGAGDIVMKALDWLKALFNWGDILLTQKVIAHTIRDMFGVYEGLLAREIPAWTRQRCGEARQWLATNIDNIEKQLGAIGDLDKLAGSGQLAARSREYEQTGERKGVLTNFVTNHIQQHVDEGGTLVGALKQVPVETAALLDGFLAELERVAANAGTDFAVFGEHIQALKDKLRSPADVFSGPVLFTFLAETLRLVGNLALTAVEAVVEAACSVAAAIMRLAKGIMDVEIQIPVLTALFHEIAPGVKMTTIDLLALAAAVPASVLHKLSHGGKPLVTQAEADRWCASSLASVIRLPGQQPVRRAAAAANETGLSLNTCNQIAAYLYVPYLVVDMTLDYKASNQAKDGVATGFGWASVVLSTAILGFSAWGAFTAGDGPHGKTIQNLNVTSWFFGWAGVIGDGVCLGRKGQAMRFMEAHGSAVTCALGVGMLALAISAQVLAKPEKPKERWLATQSILLPMPLVFQPLVLANHKVALAVLLLIDFAGDTIGGTLAPLMAAD